MPSIAVATLALTTSQSASPAVALPRFVRPALSLRQTDNTQRANAPAVFWMTVRQICVALGRPRQPLSYLVCFQPWSSFLPKLGPKINSAQTDMQAWHQAGGAKKPMHPDGVDGDVLLIARLCLSWRGPRQIFNTLRHRAGNLGKWRANKANKQINSNSSKWAQSLLHNKLNRAQS